MARRPLSYGITRSTTSPQADQRGADCLPRPQPHGGWRAIRSGLESRTTGSGWDDFFEKSKDEFAARSKYAGSTGTAQNPLRLGGAELANIAQRRAGINATNQPFMPRQDRRPMNLPNMKLSPTDPSGDAAGLARAMAMTQPGGLDAYMPQQPRLFENVDDGGVEGMTPQVTQFGDARRLGKNRFGTGSSITPYESQDTEEQQTPFGRMSLTRPRLRPNSRSVAQSAGTFY